MHGPEQQAPEAFDPSSWEPDPGPPPAASEYAETSFQRERDNTALFLIWQRFYGQLVPEEETRLGRKLSKDELRYHVGKYAAMLARHYGRSRPDRAFEEKMAEKAEAEARRRESGGRS